MKAAVLVKFGRIEDAFEIKEIPRPKIEDGQVLIQTEAFGLNYADIMAIQGDYNDCPKLPCVLGYDVVGKITEIKGNVGGLKINDRVTAFARFGAYAEFVAVDSNGCAVITEQMQAAKAIALTTQYSTAYYCLEEAAHCKKGDRVLIQSAAGGVGTALVQMALNIGCEIYATCGSEEKMDYLKEMGVHHAINYNKEDFFETIKHISDANGLDAVFDAIGGTSAKKGFKLLGPGGKLVLYGAASMTDSNIIGKLAMVTGFGLYHPVQLMMSSKGIIGVNMLQIGDYKPHVVKRCLEQVVHLLNESKIDPKVAQVFNIDELAQGLNYLKNRKSMGKISIFWK